MPMEEYHRLDILSAITKTFENNGEYYNKIILEFVPYKRVKFNYIKLNNNVLRIQMSDYLDVDCIPASFFTMTIEHTLFGNPIKYDLRTKEFFKSKQFLDSQRPIYLQRNGASYYHGTIGGIPVWTANVYDTFVPSWFFSCILVNENIDSLDDLFQFDLDPLFNRLGVPYEMRNVAICD